MKRFVTPSLIALAATLTFASPALAGDKKERATAAIAAAQAKIDAANKVGAAGETPRLTAAATAELARARDQQAGGHKDEAIAAAQHAALLADQAFGEADRAKTQNAQAATADAAASANAAQDAAAAANERAAAAEAAAARPAPAPVIIQQAPPAAPTTVTTETTAAAVPAPRRVVTRRVVKKPVRHTTVVARPAAVKVKTTTTVGN